MIWIRADANKEIGSGHIMRCLSIATALKAFGEEVCFLVAEESAAGLLEQRGQLYKILGSVYHDLEQELPLLQKMLPEENPKLLLVDSYFVTKRYLEQLRKHVKVAYIDDVPLFHYPVDMVINYNIYGDSLSYRDSALEEQQTFLLGARYAPLREQFKDVDYVVRPTVEHVMLTTGGSDKFNLAYTILQEALKRDKVRKLQYHVVSGAFNTNYSSLMALAQEYENIHVYQNVTDMAGLMKQSDIAITAGGSTMYELSAVGVPILCFAFVDNQEQIVDTFCQRNLVSYGGNYVREGQEFAANVVNALEYLCENADSRREYSEKTRCLADGRGADRIAEALAELARQG